MKPVYPHPVLLVVSAPSGAGKTTLCKRLLEDVPGLVYSVSCTTRPPRGHEVDGEDYHFMDTGKFLQGVEQGAFLEYAEVHGHWYGTPAAMIEAELAAGRSVLLDVDVQGALLIRRSLEERPADDSLRLAFADVFVSPPSLDELRSRLENRGEDAPDVIERRLLNAGKELEDAGRYQFQVINDDIEEAYRVFRSIHAAAAHRTL